MFGKAWICGALLLLGCSQNYSDKKKEEAIREKGMQPLPSHAEQAPQLPAGHPPLDAAGTQEAPGGGAGTGAAIEVKAGQRHSLGGLSVVLPEGWKPTAPTSSMRTAEYLLPGQGSGDASLVVFYFGPDQGGSVEANIDRWYGQFTQPDGKPTQEHARRWGKSVGSIGATLVDINGTYTGGGMGGGSNAPQPGYRMLGAILVAPRGPFFFKLVGPAAVVARWNTSFEQYIDSALPE
ncbi:MAG: hypothetical protein HYW07_10095 [Candidatus Latescibacteria bacterium]|nr:hypothetical protein [Candidatus Latescibacterota bacterium]